MYVIITDPLLRSYLHQADSGGKNNRIGPVYPTRHFLQRGHGIGSFFTGLWHSVRSVFWSGAKVLGRETLRTGGNILTDIARSSLDEKPRQIVSRRVAVSAQNLIAKLGWRGCRKCKRSEKKKKSPKRKSKNTKVTKRDILS